jgi:hypothetical protein
MRASDKVIVSFACKGRENYPKAQLRLVKSCASIPWDGDYIIRSLDGDCDEYCGIPILLGSYPEGSTNNHAEIPYAFKVDIIKEAIDKGYKQIIWADSTVLMAKNVNRLLAYAAEHGVAAFDNLGHPLYKWISDYALQKLNIPESVLPVIPQIMACVIIFDIENVRGKRIFDRWYAASRDGVSFQNYGSDRPGFISHRHDQAVLSGLLYQHNIPILPYGRLVYHPHEETGEFGQDIYFINKGI